MRMELKGVVVAGLAALSLAGCGSSGTPVSDGTTTPAASAASGDAMIVMKPGGSASASSVLSFSELVDLGIDVESNFMPGHIHRPVNVPSSGGASYSGFAVYTERDDSSGSRVNTYTAIGAFEATADFDAVLVTGKMDNFFELANPDEFTSSGDFLDEIPKRSGAIAGELILTLDELGPEVRGTRLNGKVTGELTKPNGQTVSFVGKDAMRADGLFEGDGNIARFIDGDADGNLPGSGRSADLDFTGIDPNTTAKGSP